MKRVNYGIKGVEDLTHCLALFVYINLDVYHLKNKPFIIIIIIIIICPGIICPGNICPYQDISAVTEPIFIKL